MADQTPEERLSDFAHASLPDNLPARDMMRLSLFDWAACTMAGRDEPVTRITRGMALEDGGAPQATLAGSETRVPARAAALVNGATSHALDYDDTHFAHIGHPSVAVIPAALSVAQAIDANGDMLIDAALVGTEASIAVGVWLGRGHYQIGFHQTATAGAFGATLAASRLMGLSGDQIRHALGIAATRAAGLKSQFGTMGKPYHAGMAAATGVEAARLAQAGFVSSTSGLSDPQGFGPTHHGAGDMAGFAGLGSDWHMLSISHKFHACCHGLHATLEALAEIKTAPQDIASIEITTHPRWLTVCNIASPATGLEAKFSYRLTAAMALAGYDTAALETYTDAVASDPDLAHLRDRVTVTASEALSETEAHVTVTARDNSAQTVTHDLSAPISLAVRSEKLRAKARALVGDAEPSLWDATAGKRAPDIGALSGLLAAG